MKILGIMLLAGIMACFGLPAGCSKKDPMDIPMKASTIEEYSESMLKISRAFKNSEDRKKFIGALEVVAFGPATALSYKLGGTALSAPGTTEKLLALSRKCDGKTPREIIAMAEKEKVNLPREDVPDQEPETKPETKPKN